MFNKILKTFPLDLEDNSKTKLHGLKARVLNNLGVYYANGLNKNPKKAFNYFISAIEIDNSYKPALRHLAKCYNEGFGVKQNIAEAERYSRLVDEALDTITFTAQTTPIEPFGNVSEEERYVFGGTRKRKTKNHRKHKSIKGKSKLNKRKYKTHKRNH